MMTFPQSSLTHLECPECGKKFLADELQTFCADCKSPLLARYDIESAGKSLTKETLRSRLRGIWRWGELLPVRSPAHRLTLGEGDTPLIPAINLGKSLGMQQLLIKDESNNPGGSFKSRGIAAALSRAIELGQREFVIPTAGNAGFALALYAARAHVKAHIYMPLDTPEPIRTGVKTTGAELTLVEGLISDAAKLAQADAQKNHWFDLSTFKEPYRVEGKKTLGFEIAESMGWQLPDVIIYPTGGGTGLVGMWKAFDELEQMGMISSARPRMVSVQSEGCAPIVTAHLENREKTVFWENAQTIAAGLRVPAVFADRLILRILKQSTGTAVCVSDNQIIACQNEISKNEGIFASPEGAAALAAARELRNRGWIHNNESVVLFNTGSGLNYLS